MGRIHAGKKVTPGGRYDRLLRFLRLRGDGGATTWEIWEQARVAAPSTVVSELRALGYVVEAKEETRSTEGAKVWRYWLRTEPAAKPAAQPAPPPGELFARTG